MIRHNVGHDDRHVRDRPRPSSDWVVLIAVKEHLSFYIVKMETAPNQILRGGVDADIHILRLLDVNRSNGGRPHPYDLSIKAPNLMAM
jgi:hypothetical protein